MPKYNQQQLFKFSRFEVELLRYVADKARVRKTDVVREAMRLYAKSHPQFDAQDFGKHVLKEVVPELKKLQDREDMKEELEEFLATSKREVRPAFSLSPFDQEITVDSRADFGARSR